MQNSWTLDPLAPQPSVSSIHPESLGKEPLTSHQVELPGGSGWGLLLCQGEDMEQDEFQMYLVGG